MKLGPRSVPIVAAALLAGGCAANKESGSTESPAPVRRTGHAEPDVARVLDELHDAASKAQFDRYFALFAPDAVFIGTDASERWTLEQFKAYTKPIFAKGKGWTYTPTQRHIAIDGDFAWFDELPVNAKYGTCRGSGVLRRTGGTWRIVQYNLSVPIPNDLLPKVADEIRAYEAAHPQPAAGK